MSPSRHTEVSPLLHAGVRAGTLLLALAALPLAWEDARGQTDGDPPRPDSAASASVALLLWSPIGPLGDLSSVPEDPLRSPAALARGEILSPELRTALPVPSSSLPLIGDSRAVAMLSLEIRRAEERVRMLRRLFFGSRGLLRLGTHPESRTGLLRLRLQYDPDPGVRFVVHEPGSIFP